MTKKLPAPALLPANALSGVMVGISASESSDLGRLGFIETHFRLALAEIARCVVVSGGRLSYGGRLDPTGYTSFLVKELQRFSRRDRPLLVTLSYGEHMALTLDQLAASRDELGLFGQLECLDAEGQSVDGSKDRQVAASPVTREVAERGLTRMREHLATICDARVLLGGKRQNYLGAMPGVIEECILSIERKKPVFLAAGFGGVTFDLAKALGVDDGAWFPTNDSGTPDKGLATGLKQVAAMAKDKGLGVPSNGLTATENKMLAATHRPSEIATLVSLGLGRLVRASTSG